LGSRARDPLAKGWGRQELDTNLPRQIIPIYLGKPGIDLQFGLIATRMWLCAGYPKYPSVQQMSYLTRWYCVEIADMLRRLVEVAHTGVSDVD
jgi:hypothetical protein